MNTQRKIHLTCSLRLSVIVLILLAGALGRAATFSGQVTDNGSGVEGVNIRIVGTSTGAHSNNTVNVQTDASGNWSSGGWLLGYNIAITPQQNPYTFLPSGRSFAFAALGANRSGLNFDRVSSDISGKVTAGTKGIQGVTIGLSGPSNKTTQTATDGTYSFTNVPLGDYTITPAVVTDGFTPVSRAITLSGNLLNQNFKLNRPVATTTMADGVAFGSAVFKGMVDGDVDLGFGGTVSAKIRFEYGLQGTLGTPAAAILEIAEPIFPTEASGSVPVSAGISGLLPGTLYDFRLKASYLDGAGAEVPGTTHTGEIQSFLMPYPAAATAVQFDGTGDRVEVVDSGLEMTTALTIEAWIFPTGPGTVAAGQGSAIVCREGEYLLARFADGSIRYALKIDTPSWVFVDTNVDVPLDQWTHLAFTYDSTVANNPRIRLFVNGALAYSGNGSGPIGDALADDKLWIGGRPAVSAYFKGQIDEVRVWSIARNAGDILRDYRRSLFGTESGLAGYWRFNDGMGVTAANGVPGAPAGSIAGDVIFVSSAAPLTDAMVDTQPASPVGATKATLRGVINPVGNETSVRFQYGETIAYGNQVAVGSSFNGTAPVSVSAEILGLQPGTTYHYRCVVENLASGVIEGRDQTFTTLVLGVGWPTTTKVTGGFTETPKHCLDTLGNAYVAGRFSGSLNLGGALVSMNGTTDAFVGKLGRGADWLWGNRVIAGPASDVTIEEIGIDADRNVFVVGHFTGTITFPAAVEIPLTSTGVSDGFVAKLNSSGNGWLWARKLGTTGSDRVNALVVTEAGEVMVAGQVGAAVNVVGSGGTNYPIGGTGVSDLFVARLDTDGNWLWATGGANGEPANSSNANALVLTSQGDAFVTGEFTGSVGFPISSSTSTLVSAGDSDIFISRISGNGQWLVASRAGSTDEDTATALAVNAVGEVYLFGKFSTDATFASGTTKYNTQVGTEGKLFVAKLSSNASLLSYYQAGRGEAGGIAVDSAGRVYITGDFSISIDFGSTQTQSLISSGSLDVFVARLSDVPDQWDWIKNIGSSGMEGRGELRVGPGGGLVVSGTFQNTVQVGHSLLTTSNDHEIFVARLDAEAVFEHNNYVIGEAIPVPVEAQQANGSPIGQPSISLISAEHQDSDTLNSFVWDSVGRNLYPVRPVTAILKWPLTTDPANTTAVATAVGRSTWPDNPRIHIASAPVELQPAVTGFPYRFNSISLSTGVGVAVDGSPTKVFTAANPGLSVLQFFDNEGEESPVTLKPLHFEVVRTVPWDDGVSKPAVNTQSATIGTELGNPEHNDPTGKNGFVVLTGAAYDGAGDDKAYDRTTRTGPIIPVNLETAATNDDLVVAWYHAEDVQLPDGGTTKGIAWPSLAVRYQPQWPENPDELVLSRGDGSGVLPQDAFPGKRVYRQPDPSLPGYNPNEEHAALYGDTLYALRNDLNDLIDASEPYVLLKYRAPASAAMPNRWMMKIYKVVTQNAAHPFAFSMVAGQPLLLPSPLDLLPLSKDFNKWTEGPGFRDHRGELHARAAGPGGATAVIKSQYWYPLQPDFFYDFDGIPGLDFPTGTSIPWLGKPNGTGEDGKGTDPPVEITYTVSWPTQVPVLKIGATLIDGDPVLDPPDPTALPDLVNFVQAQVVHDDGNPDGSNPASALVRLYEPIQPRTLQIRSVAGNNPDPGIAVFVPADEASLFTGLATENDAGLLSFTDLPYFLRSRLRYDPLNKNLIFQGIRDDGDVGEQPLVLSNVLSPRERDRIKKLKEGNVDFGNLIDALYELTRDPDHVNSQQADPPIQIGFERRDGLIATKPLLGESIVKALSAGGATSNGYVTLVINNDASLGVLPVSLHVLRVEGDPELGDINVLESDNVFDQKLTLRHSGDFGGEPQNFEFEWYFRPSSNGSVLPGSGSDPGVDGWTKFQSPPPGPPSLGLNDITLGDGGTSNLLILADNYYICRYRRDDGVSPWSDWIGNALERKAQFVEGWVGRVRNGLNPFEARSADFHKDETVTFASMLQQAGTRYEGSVAVKAGEDINQIGLIEAYGTVLQSAKQLSIDASPPENFQPANDALLSAAGYIADLYFLLGNEATADAADPTIGFRTSSTGYGTLAPSIFTFQNQVDSLLEEELGLLRGRDDSAASVRGAPAYNRLFWNFTRDEGEVAYAQAYNITDQDNDGFIGVNDARIMFPQGHGDAWGHYLTATKTYFDLMRNPFFVWIPRTELIQLGTQDVEINNFDERKFARAAAAKAKVGAEIVDLTYRLNYVDDPSGQYQGYKDTNSDRAWGVSEWAQRAGSAALFDWVAANAVLPAEDTGHTGIEKIDRTTVPELDEIIAGYESVQSQVDKADAGLNPLGIGKNSVPFDIDPSLVSAGKTHFEQIYDRAAEAVKNTVTVFDHANQLTQALRGLQDDVNDFSGNVDDQERDYKNRMIEIFGYPYAGDIGTGKTYPAGYTGPDIYHYMYVNTVEVTGEPVSLGVPSEDIVGQFTSLGSTNSGIPKKLADYFFKNDVPLTLNSVVGSGVLSINYPVSNGNYACVAPNSWGERDAPGEIQAALSDLLQAQSRMRQGISNYDSLTGEIRDAAELLEARYNLRSETLGVRNRSDGTTNTLKGIILTSNIIANVLKGTVENADQISDITLESLPKVVGTSNDATAPVRGAIKSVTGIGTKILKVGANIATGVAEGAKKAIEENRRQSDLEISGLEFAYETQQKLKELEQLIRKEPGMREEAYALGEAVNQSMGRYQAAVAKGLRLMDERIAFRKSAAAETQQNRYQDMTFRIFRNDAIQKYRAQLDLAAKYVYMAAVAYDYETQLLGGDHGAGREFLTDIVKQRALGEVINGQPVAGRHGLADPLARLSQNFGVLKGQLGFNNPQTETGRFSLRNGLFRLRGTSDAEWRDELKKHIVPNLWDIPEFRRHCRPFAPESAGPQPGLVIRFPTTVTFGLNYFGWPLGGGDSAYDSTSFATKVRSAGVWFSNYDGSGLSLTPRIYLVPAGADVMRSPSGNNLETRQWRVVDQKIPVPFPIGYNSLNDPKWIPANDSLSDTLGDIRRFSSFRAYHDSGVFDPAQTISDSRLIGRSVWNTDWMLIMPGGTFLFDSNEGLDKFIDSVSDIKIFFQTYAYSGN
ncbi:MAG: LamG-like jellyroll fold domain-containing protein [Verrucomicrobiota bacterium]